MSLKGVSNTIMNYSFFSKRYQILECRLSSTRSKQRTARAPFYTLMFWQQPKIKARQRQFFKKNPLILDCFQQNVRNSTFSRQSSRMVMAWNFYSILYHFEVDVRPFQTSQGSKVGKESTVLLGFLKYLNVDYLN